MGLFGFGSKKDKTPTASASDTFSLSGPANAATLKCILTAGVRKVEMTADMNGSGNVVLTHGPAKIEGVNAIEAYLDVKGEGMALKPKKARHLADQCCWMQAANQFLDQGENIDTVLSAMNELLGKQDFLAEPFSLAEPHVAASVFSLKKAGTCPSGLDNVDAWLKRVEDKIPENLRAACMSHTS